MKKIIHYLFVCLACMAISCEDDTSKDMSKITYFVNYEILGDETMLLPVGTPYVEPGVIAMEGETDITSSVVITGSVDASAIGIYDISYSATNVDGFSSSVSRTVVVYDPSITTDISGVYTAAAGTHRLAIATGATVSYADYSVTLTSIAPGVFQVSDFFAGYYEVRAGYGSSYAMRGYIKLNADNSLGLLSSSVAGWGDSLDRLEDGAYDPVSGTVSWGAVYAGAYSFNVILTK
ncbi:BT_2262 family domain-containing protein [uncultured Proteiniphilum sp.]|uniref:BT_2262 family domain-containing protein n=1 Tax=uncultured Proteiniphilum sp. TaxID=497637 RepID=UPI002634C459|nr:BT_2262 family domain-containing protein [uncultured Proteiniphilum sp.]